jgi:hypothetical protein
MDNKKEGPRTQEMAYLGARGRSSGNGCFGVQIYLQLLGLLRYLHGRRDRRTYFAGTLGLPMTNSGLKTLDSGATGRIAGYQNNV